MKRAAVDRGMLQQVKDMLLGATWKAIDMCWNHLHTQPLPIEIVSQRSEAYLKDMLKAYPLCLRLRTLLAIDHRLLCGSGMDKEAE